MPAHVARNLDEAVDWILRVENAMKRGEEH
jgi:hypothetical protein